MACCWVWPFRAHELLKHGLSTVGSNGTFVKKVPPVNSWVWPTNQWVWPITVDVAHYCGCGLLLGGCGLLISGCGPLLSGCGLLMSGCGLHSLCIPPQRHTHPPGAR